jgi:hypothetical protein
VLFDERSWDRLELALYSEGMRAVGRSVLVLGFVLSSRRSSVNATFVSRGNGANSRQLLFVSDFTFNVHSTLRLRDWGTSTKNTTH